VTAAFITPAARSYSLCDSAAIMSTGMLGRASTNSCPRRRRARVIHTPCASTSSTISCSTRSSHAILNDGASRGAGVVGFGAFKVVDDDSVAQSRWMWMICEEACEGIAIASTRGPARPGWPELFLGIDGVFRRMLMPSEARLPGKAEKKNGVQLMRW
jgi:hypothetical protein